MQQATVMNFVVTMITSTVSSSSTSRLCVEGIYRLYIWNIYMEYIYWVYVPGHEVYIKSTAIPHKFSGFAKVFFFLLSLLLSRNRQS